jgi:hypothetical protein
LTWVACECGCGLEGEDDVAQFCIEEAALMTLDAKQAEALEEAQTENQPDPRPGEITDPELADAMAKAKQAHFEQVGVQV